MKPLELIISLVTLCFGLAIVTANLFSFDVDVNTGLLLMILATQWSRP